MILYGIVDLGVNYTHVDMDGQGDDLDNFEMKSGQQSGSRYDNSIVYRTPSFAGFQVTAMYSMGQSTDGKGTALTGAKENESSTDRYYGIAATYNNGPFAACLAVDSTNYKSLGVEHGDDMNDSLTVTLGGSWDFEVAKFYLGAQYFDEALMSSVGGILGKNSAFGLTGSKFEGFGVALGADAPIAGGKGMIGVGYLDASQSDFQEDYGGSDFDFTRWVVSVGYDYPLSKRTTVYGVMSYMDDDYDDNTAAANSGVNPSAYTFMIGMRHKF